MGLRWSTVFRGKRARSSSHKTAIARSDLSVPMRFLFEREALVGRVLDFGCGRGQDAEFLAGIVDIEKYDPHFFPEKPQGLFDTITCIYVLNTIVEPDGDRVVREIEKMLVPGGAAYFAVRRDVFKEGFNGRGTYQRMVKMNCPLVHEDQRMAIYELRTHVRDGE